MSRPGQRPLTAALAFGILSAMTPPLHRLMIGLLLIALCLASCLATPGGQATRTRKEQVTAMLDSLRSDLDAEGPAAWADYLVDDPSLFVTLPSGLALTGPGMAARKADELREAQGPAEQRLENVRIDLIDPIHVAVRADYVEVFPELERSDRTRVSRVVGVAIETSRGWRFERLHFESDA